MSKLRSLTLLILLGIMQGRSSFRCVSAFASRLFLPSQRLVHGGSSFGAFTTRGGSVSPSSSPPTATSSEDSNIVQDTLGIFDANEISPAVFAGIPYWDTSNSSEFRVFFVLGGPGAGKGTQCTLLKDNYPCVHYSVGELLRNVPEDSPHAALIQETLVKGNIVPVEISLSLLKSAMESQQGKSLYYLVDGFPRNFDNLEGWNRLMNGVSSVWGVLMFQCPLEVMEQRIMSRAETSGRSDDNLASAQRRFATFERETVPVVNILSKVEALTSSTPQHLRVMNIRGDRPLERVWDDTQCLMNQFILHDVVTANAQLLKAVEEGNAELYQSLVELGNASDDAEAVMTANEGASTTRGVVSNGLMDFVSGTKVVVSYDRKLSDSEPLFRETRVWSHQGDRGWINIHFSRTPL